MSIDEGSALLSPDELVLLGKLPRRRLRQVAARKDLISQGDRPSAVNMVVAGWGCRYKQLPDGRRQLLSLFLPGDICDANVFLLDVMDHSIGALTALTVAEFTPEDFTSAVCGEGRVARVLWFNELRAIALQREWTTNIGVRSGLERTAHLLCEIFARLQHIGHTQGDECDFHLTQTDLAEATGLTPVHINRMLQELRRRGLISLSHRRLRIPDLRALEAQALFDRTYLHYGEEM